MSCLDSNPSPWFPPFLFPVLHFTFQHFYKILFSIYVFFYIAPLHLECFLGLSSIIFPALLMLKDFSPCNTSRKPSPLTLPTVALLLCPLFTSGPAICYDYILCMDLSTRLNSMTTGMMSYLHLYSQ